MRLAVAVLALSGLLLCADGCGSPCNPSSCTGCCDSSGACQPGTQADACGGEAKACAKCSGYDRCGTTSRSCGPCGSANCSGCCTSDGRCFVEVRDRDTNCGFNGAACVDCMAMGKTCSTAKLGCQ